MILEKELTQNQSDVIWLAKGHYFKSTYGEPVYIEKPTANEAMSILGLSYLDMIELVTGLVAVAILDSDDPIKEFKEMIYYASVSLIKKTESINFDVIPKKIVSDIFREHILEFCLIIIARWDIPDEYIMKPPSWNPDKKGKKK